MPVKENLDSFILKEIDKKKLFNFLREMEFNRLLSSVISEYGEIEFDNSKKEDIKIKDTSISNKNYILIENISEIDQWLEQAENNGELSIDTETSSIDPNQADLLGISISTKIGHACYIPLGHSNTINLDKDKVLKKLKPVLEDKSIKKIGQNIKFDFIVFYHQGILLNNMEDTMLMSYVLDAGKNRHNMDTLSEIHLGHKTISYKEIVGTGKKEIKFSDVEISLAKDYASEDADITYRLYRLFLKNLKSEKLIHIYEIFEKPLIKILAFMEIEGIKLDIKFLKILSSKFEKKLKLWKLKFLKFPKNNSILRLQNNWVR